MKYYFGIDGGGTKTLCYIGDENGQVIGTGRGGKCNYQLCGIKTAKESILTAVEMALEDAGLSLEDLTSGVLGLSGADEDRDIDILTKACRQVFGHIPFNLMNDTWIGLRAGAAYGIVSICGTGAAHAGVNQKGERFILRNLGYELGNYGGGSEIVKEAMHFAFRSNEGTYKKSGLEDMIIGLFKVSDMDEVSRVYRKQGLSEQIEFEIPKKVFQLANSGYQVAIEIISKMGANEGMYAAAVIRKLGLEHEQVPLILIGSLFRTNHKILVGAYMKEVKKTAPKAYYIIPDRQPVEGALMLAVELGL